MGTFSSPLPSAVLKRLPRVLPDYPVALDLGNRTNSGPRAAYVLVCDYNCQWSSPPVASPRHVSQIIDEWHNGRVRECFIVEKPLYWGDSTVSPGKSWSSGTVNRYGWRLPGCSGWPGHLSVTSMLWCTPRHLLTSPSATAWIHRRSLLLTPPGISLYML